MLKRGLVLVVVLTAVAGYAFADLTWNIDKAHSSIGFSVRHLVISKTKGSFHDYDAVVSFDGKNIETASAKVTIKMASIDTDNKDRDDHLRSADFFHVEKYPTMTFTSKKVIAGEGNEFIMVGDLTIKDVTREVTLHGEFYGITDDSWGNTRAGLSASTTINRQDFNVSWDNKLQDGSLIVGNDVDITLEIELIKSK